MKGILGVYFVVKQEQRSKELVEMILLWLISSFCQSLGVESIDQTGKWNPSYQSAQTSSQSQ